MTYTTRVALANSVPAAAVIQKGRALSELIGRKTHVGGLKDACAKLGFAQASLINK